MLELTLMENNRSSTRKIDGEQEQANSNLFTADSSEESTLTLGQYMTIDSHSTYITMPHKDSNGNRSNIGAISLGSYANREPLSIKKQASKISKTQLKFFKVVGSAACLGTEPNIFFPRKGEPDDLAKECCESCPIKNECLDYAIENNEKFGVWGGMNLNERMIEKRQRSNATKDDYNN
ncbi:MAG: WhiB family transcriptional regulator [Candidatus Saccharibacteria bacterium]